MNRNFAHRGIAALTLTLALGFAGAQPAAARNLDLWQQTLDRIAVLWSRGDAAETPGLWQTLGAWWSGAQEKVSTSGSGVDTVDQGLGADPMGHDANTGDLPPVLPGPNN
jgi:hypothetical protein